MTTASEESAFSPERRQLYRVDDRVVLEILPAVDSAEDSAIASTPFFRLSRELRRIDQSSNNLLRGIRQQQADIANYLQAINEKVDLLCGVLSDALLEQSQSLQVVDLSQGGMGFKSEQALSCDSRHRANLWFEKSLLGLTLEIRIVACRVEKDGRHHISAEFCHLAESERQLLAKHVMSVQSLQRRSRSD